MKLGDFAILADENIEPDVLLWLRNAGFDVEDVHSAGLVGATDVDVMREAFANQRVIVTHDSDFGALAILRNEPVVGLIYLRPGHIDPDFTIGTLASLLNADPDVTPPFVVVARRKGNDVVIRIRRLT